MVCKSLPEPPLRRVACELGYLSPGIEVKTVYNIELELETPLHIGSGREPEEPYVYSAKIPLVLETTRQEVSECVVIPESELKGALRSFCELTLLGHIDGVVEEFLREAIPKLTCLRPLAEIKHENVVRNFAELVKISHTQYGHRLVEEIAERYLSKVFRVAWRRVERRLDVICKTLEDILLHLYLETSSDVELDKIRLLNIIFPAIYLATRAIEEYMREVGPQVIDRFRQEDLLEAIRDLSVALVELLCPICRVFGGSKIADRLVVTTFTPDLSTYSVRTLTRTSISRYTQTVEEKRLFTVEFVEPRTVYRGEIVLELDVDRILNGDELWIRLDRPVISMLTEHVLKEGSEITIGGLKSIGYGLARVKSVKKMRIVATESRIEIS